MPERVLSIISEHRRAIPMFHQKPGGNICDLSITPDYALKSFEETTSGFLSLPEDILKGSFLSVVADFRLLEAVEKVILQAVSKKNGKLK
ncbi:hypothetical protein CEXT_713851 [Caerostris extrusa]|uniref:Uncharacterized protein n=1 Tax=Caerostris extrusa TaxID=172846 RepID=A0AAV4S7S4_CAEEX|nr:hypothetical protein CEXT_713851 [Caerostris extrusa]